MIAAAAIGVKIWLGKFPAMRTQEFASPKSFHAVMKDHEEKNFYRVAHYQRRYLWTEKQVWRLLEDVSKSTEKKRRFPGFIITCSPSSASKVPEAPQYATTDPCLPGKASSTRVKEELTDESTSLD